MNLSDSDATEAAGAALAAALQAAAPKRACVWLQGELGAGKTTFCRGLLRALGHAGRVPSPTYTLVEPYEYAGYRLFHLDLYRLSAAAELEFLGIDDMWGSGAVLLVEWPQNARDGLPPADLEVSLSLSEGDTMGRKLQFQARTEVGEALRQKLGHPYQT
jgi:tRNA threonylcarbamoyladenosine biosynthesis protein TsaE